MLKKLFDTISSTLRSDNTLIRQGLASLDHLQSGLGERAAAFVADGSDTGVLADLQSHGGKGGTYLGEPGRLRWNFNFSRLADKEHANAAKASLQARDALYARIDANEDIPLLVRLGKVLQAADQGQVLDRPGATMPDWLNYLLNDALWASAKHNDAQWGIGASELQPVASRTAWDIRLVAALLRDDGFHMDMLLPIVFERRGLDSYYAHRVYSNLLAPGVLDEYLRQHVDETERAAAVLAVAGRTLLCERIGAGDGLVTPFAPLLVKLAVSDSKAVRTAASQLLDRIDSTQRLSLLETALRQGQGDQRAMAADLLARLLGSSASSLLESALAQESSKSVQQSIRGALARLTAASAANRVELPDPPALPEIPETSLGSDTLAVLQSNRDELVARLRTSAAEEDEQNRTAKYQSKWRREMYEGHLAVTDHELKQALAVLNGDTSIDARLLERDAVQSILNFSGRLASRADFGLHQALRWIGAIGNGYRQPWYDQNVQRWLGTRDVEQVDLRQLAALGEKYGLSPDTWAKSCLMQAWGALLAPQHLLPPHRVWPYFAEHPELIDEGLGLAPSQQGHGTFDIGMTLDVLATFPSLPASWLPRVMEIALGDGKQHRLAAQEALATLPGLCRTVAEALDSGKQEVRIVAAQWLARLGDRAAVPMLYAALEKENRETAAAALMTALEHLGEDLAPLLAPERLLAQARKGLKAKPPAGLAWLNLDLLPACDWRDSTPVEQEVIRWWVILACKLKEPAGNALLERYVGLLSPASQAALGSHLLHQFIAKDSACRSHDEGMAWAQAHAEQRYQDYQDSARRYPEYYAQQGKLSREQVFEQVKNEKMAEYLGSAINEKGILALAHGAPGHELVAALQQFMRDHYVRRAQVEALLEAACVSNHPAVIQFTLGVARRYRTAAVQEKARLLVDRIAERNGWSRDELGDRTVPTAGFDEQGVLALQYGLRQYTVTLDQAMKPSLRNPEGKIVAALPAPRQDDPPELVKEAKQLLSAGKKELKQVVTQQTGRLYESMCTGRIWPAADWREYILAHPLLGRLAQRLVWLDCSEDGTPLRQFRPAEDGALLDTSDDEVELHDSGFVRLAHASIIEQEAAALWKAHFKDYKITPLFAQMHRAAPDLGNLAPDRIADREGWVSDTFTLRGAFTKLGYQRAAAEDGGFFSEYSKEFSGAGIVVQMAFSGNTLPEENVPAALVSLSFASIGKHRYLRHALPLDKVPSVLLAEAYGDYHAVASSCAGFDPQWKQKMPW